MPAGHQDEDTEKSGKRELKGRLEEDQRFGEEEKKGAAGEKFQWGCAPVRKHQQRDRREHDKGAAGGDAVAGEQQVAEERNEQRHREYSSRRRQQQQAFGAAIEAVRSRIKKGRDQSQMQS